MTRRWSLPASVVYSNKLPCNQGECKPFRVTPIFHFHKPFQLDSITTRTKPNWIRHHHPPEMKKKNETANTISILRLLKSTIIKNLHEIVNDNFPNTISFFSCCHFINIYIVCVFHVWVRVWERGISLVISVRLRSHTAKCEFRELANVPLSISPSCGKIERLGSKSRYLTMFTCNTGKRQGFCYFHVSHQNTHRHGTHYLHI